MPPVHEILVARALDRMFLKQHCIDNEDHCGNSVILSLCVFGATIVLLIAAHVKIVLFIVIGVLIIIAFMIASRWMVDTGRAINKVKETVHEHREE